MADKKISEMATASVVDNDDNLELSHSVNGAFTSVKASILAIATKMLTAINFTSALQTTDKTVIGAINEVAQGGGGGTTVIANPTGTPTDDLNSIQIGNDIYRIVGGSGGGGTAKALVMKTKTWTGDGQVSKSITFDEKPIAIFNIWGAGEGTNIYCLNSPFIYGETNYFISSYSGGIIIPSISYSNDGLTMTMSGADAGYAFNCANAPYTMWYLVEEEVGGSADWTDITGTLVAGQTSITLNDSSILESSTFDFYTSKFGVNPIDVELTVHKIKALRQELVTQESELDVSVTANSSWSGYEAWKAFLSSGGAWIGDGGNPHWLQVEFDSIISIREMDFVSVDSSRSHPISRIGYSNDGVNFNECGILNSTMINDVGHCELDNDYEAKYFRIYFDGDYGLSSYPCMSQLEIYGYDEDPQRQKSITLTFEAQSENLNVKVRVS